MEIFCDGACRGNQLATGQKGAHAFVVTDNDVRIYHEVDTQLETTNNRMELMAVIAAFKWLWNNRQLELLTIISDSQYVVNGATTWIHGWKKNGWKNSTRKPIENKDLWEILHNYHLQFPLKFQWIRGHDGNEFNELCDTLCNNALDNLN